MKLVSVHELFLCFSPECECEHLKRVEITPYDLMETGTPICGECDVEYDLESWVEITGEVRER